MTKAYGLLRKKEVISSLDLSIEEGSFVGILGPNGAGKSTMLKMLTNISIPTSGTITIRGVDVNEHPGLALEGVGCLVDTPGFSHDHTPRRFYAEMGALLGLSTEAAGTESERVLELMEMTRWADQKVKKFSKGMKQRISLGQAFLGEPGILVLDEPMFGLDPNSVITVTDALESVRRKNRGTTVIMTTHDLSDINDMFNTVAVLDRGKMVWYGDVDSFYSVKRTSDVTVKAARAFSQKDVDELMGEEYVRNVAVKKDGAVVTIDSGKFNKSRLLKRLIRMDIGITDIVEEDEPEESYAEILRGSERED